MPKLSPPVSNLVPKIARAVLGSCPSENRLVRSASHAVVPLIRSCPLVHPCKPIQPKQYAKHVFLRQAGGLGAMRAFSVNMPPPKRLVDCYQAVLEDAILNQRDIIEMVEHDSFCIVGYVEKSLNASSGVPSNLFGNGYLITEIKGVWHSGNTPARMYELQVQPPEVAGKVRKPFVLPLTVFKTEVLRDLNPDNLRGIFAACSIAVKVHSGKLPMSFSSSLKLFSSNFSDLGKLYFCAESIRTMISTHYISTPKELFQSIQSHLNDCAIDMESPFVPALHGILISEFRKINPLYGTETESSLRNRLAKKQEPKLFRHDITHKGGAYRGAMMLNAFAKAEPYSGVSSICVIHSDGHCDQVFVIDYDPRGVWVEKRPNVQTQQIETIDFAKPEQLSDMLKQRGVQAIVSRSLGTI